MCLIDLIFTAIMALTALKIKIKFPVRTSRIVVKIYWPYTWPECGLTFFLLSVTVILDPVWCALTTLKPISECVFLFLSLRKSVLLSFRDRWFVSRKSYAIRPELFIDVLCMWHGSTGFNGINRYLWYKHTMKLHLDYKPDNFEIVIVL